MIETADSPRPAESYQPDPVEAKLISAIESKRERSRSERSVHEAQWYLNAAFERGNQYVEFSAINRQLITPSAPPHRVRLRINRLRAKTRMRTAKFLKNRPRPFVVPATSEYRDFQNAKATQKAIDYAWRKHRLERKYHQATLWARSASKGFWWFHWDDRAISRIALPGPMGQSTYEDAPIGDFDVEVGSPFELLVADQSIASLGDQPWIMRLKMRSIEDVRARYPDYAHFFAPTVVDHDAFRYEQQIGALSSQQGIGSGMKKGEKREQILVTEYFEHPCATYPEGRYVVLVGGVLVRKEEALPLGFAGLDNPFPVVEFPDSLSAGQFWGPTELEQMIDLQREYNLLRSKLSESIRLTVHPKLLVAKQHALAKGVWGTEPGEVIEYVAIPNIPPPAPWTPPNVAQDLWRALELMQREFDDITQIYPAAEGKVGTATSGFQTNLLQEASDVVHGPDIRIHEMAIEEAAVKIRRIMKLGYDVPRLLSVVGTNGQPEVFEFSSSQIDEMADVIVEAGSALPTLKAARQEAIMGMYDKGLFGDPMDPSVRARTMGLLELGAVEEAFDFTRTDEREARLELSNLQQGRPIDPPRAWQNHLVHYEIHATFLKSPEFHVLAPELQRALVEHVILTARNFNPQLAYQMAMEEGFPELAQQIQGQIQALFQQQMMMGQPSGEAPVQ